MVPHKVCLHDHFLKVNFFNLLALLLTNQSCDISNSLQINKVKKERHKNIGCGLCLQSRQCVVFQICGQGNWSYTGFL